MSQFDPIAERVMLPAQEYFAGLSWELGVGTKLTPERIKRLENSTAVMLAGAFSEAVSDLVSEHLRLSRDAVRTHVEWQTMSWHSPPLELAFALRATPLMAAWRQGTPSGMNAEQLRRFQIALMDRLRKCATATGEAVASVHSHLQFVDAWGRPMPAGHAEVGDGHIGALDLQSVRSQQVPIEYALLLDSIISAAGQMLSLADLVGIARSQSIKDEDVLSGMNFYIDKGYLAFDRTHQVLRLTAHGRAASTNPMRDRE